MRTLKPYIGIMDCVNERQVNYLRASFAEKKPANTDHLLHIGIMVSPCNLVGTVANSNWEKFLMPIKEIPSLLCHSDLHNCVHFADKNFDKRNRFTQEQLLTDAIKAGGENLHALQLDLTVLPEPLVIDNAIQTAGRHIEVIAQISNPTETPEQLVGRISEYGTLISRVLLDRSRGKGIPVNSDILIPYIQVLRKSFPKLSIGASGGLGAGNIHLIEPLLKEDSNLFWDMQRNAHVNSCPSYPLDLERCDAYLTESFAAIQKFK